MATVNRVNGIVSGFDTENMVKDLMKIEKMKVDKAKQDKEWTIWQKDSYKEFSSLLRGLQSEFLDLLKPGSNLTSKTMFNVYNASVTLNGTVSSALTVKTSSASVKGTISVDQITQLASKDTWTSGSEVKALQGTAIDLTALNSAIASGSETFKVTLDGVTKSISLSGAYGSLKDAVLPATDFEADLQSKLNAAFGTGRITADVSDGTNLLSLSAPGSSVVLAADGSDGSLATVGFASGASNVLSTSSTLASAFGLVADPVFTINGVSSATMGITSTNTIKEMMDKVNASAAGVNMTYNSISNKFEMKAKSEGAVNNIALTDTSGFFANQLKLSDALGRVSGKDAQLVVNGVSITRSSNTFMVDGTELSLKNTYTPADPLTASDITVEIATDPSKAVAVIKSFIEKYNDLIDKISLKTSEKRYRDYAPLTEEQRADMTEDQIKLWESKAKTGTLRGDAVLTGIAEKMRAAVFQTVTGAGIDLKEMGITTSSNYKDGGKLILNEEKLTTALAQKPEEVIKFFTQESSVEYTDSANRSTRDSENGFANRIKDIVQDQIRLVRDSSGKRGVLIEKAGNEKDSTEALSSMAKSISRMDVNINKLLETMADKEERLYARFTQMESMLSKMNAQFASTFGQSGSGSA